MIGAGTATSSLAAAAGSNTLSGKAAPYAQNARPPLSGPAGFPLQFHTHRIAVGYLDSRASLRLVQVSAASRIHVKDCHPRCLVTAPLPSGVMRSIRPLRHVALSIQQISAVVIKLTNCLRSWSPCTILGRNRCLASAERDSGQLRGWRKSTRPQQNAGVTRLQDRLAASHGPLEPGLIICR